MRAGLSIRGSSLALMLAVVMTFAGCGGDGERAPRTPRPATPVPTTQPTPMATPDSSTPAMTELRVAFINLLSPVSLDVRDQTAAETFDDRLTVVIQQLREFKPDIVGFTEATWTREHEHAKARLAKELKMEPSYVRSNPWFPQNTNEQNEELRKQVGFEEGELILTRYGIKDGNVLRLNPRTSETEGRAALWVRVETPAGDVDVYIAHLTGGGDRVKQAQATSLLNWVGETRGKGPVVVFADLTAAPDSAVTKVFLDWGLKDAVLGPQPPLLTCCRDGVVGEQNRVTTRMEYIFTEGWPDAAEVGVFANEPYKRADGTLLYGSDRNGLFAVLPVPPRAGGQD
jgi:hypothetical protein